jgi:hypothetical protein
MHESRDFFVGARERAEFLKLDQIYSVPDLDEPAHRPVGG